MNDNGGAQVHGAVNDEVDVNRATPVPERDVAVIVVVNGHDHVDVHGSVILA